MEKYNKQEIDTLNLVYDIIHDLYHFGLIANNDGLSDDIMLYNIKMFVGWMLDNLDVDDYDNIHSYFYYLPHKHGGAKIGTYNTTLFDRSQFVHRSRRRMIVPFKYLKKINGMYPLESVYNDNMFTYGGTEELLKSYRKLCEAYKKSENEYISKYPENKQKLHNHDESYNKNGKIIVRNGDTLLRMLCWWDIYGRLTGKTTDLNYMDVSGIGDFSYAFSSTSRFLSDMEDEDKSGIFKLLNKTSWKYDISSWKPDKAKSMQCMFRYCKHIPECIKHWDVSSVEDMSGMFKNAANIPDIGGWNVGSVKMMFDMFGSAKDIPDISGWDVRNVIDMRCMFSNVGYVPDISKWKTDKLQVAIRMFERANITTDLSEWNVSNVNDFTSMFEGTVFRKDTDFTKWNMKNARYLSGMFKYSRGHLWVSEEDDDFCYGHGIFGMVRSSNIIVMDVAAWNVSNVLQMNEMFMGSDFSADLSMWNVSNVEWAEGFDEDCDYPHKNPNFNEGCYV